MYVNILTLWDCSHSKLINIRIHYEQNIPWKIILSGQHGFQKRKENYKRSEHREKVNILCFIFMKVLILPGTLRGSIVAPLAPLFMRGSTQREALATQREKNIPHVKLINNFFFLSKGKIKSSICFGKLPM